MLLIIGKKSMPYGFSLLCTCHFPNKPPPPSPAGCEPFLKSSKRSYIYSLIIKTKTMVKQSGITMDCISEARSCW